MVTADEVSTKPAHNVTTTPRYSDIPSNIHFVILDIILAVFVCVGNGLVLFAGFKYKQLRTPTNIFLFNLALADLSVGLLAAPIRVITNCIAISNIHSTFLLCNVKFFSLVISLDASSFLLLSMSIDRCISIYKPLKYRALISKKRATAICAVIWFYTVTEAVICWYFWVYPIQTSCSLATVLTWPFALFPVIKLTIVKLCLIVLYVAILFRVKRSLNPAHCEESYMRQQSTRGMDEMHDSEAGVEHTRSCCTLCPSLGQAYKTVITLVAVYALCTTPFVLLVLTQLVYQSRGDMINDNIRLGLEVTISIWILNSGVNPIIYHARLPAFRNALLSLLRRKHGDLNPNLT